MIIYDLKEDYGISKLCEYLKVSRSAYYQWIERGKPIRHSFDNTLADMIEEIFLQTKKGYRFIRDEILRRYGVIYNDKTVYKYMKILNLSSPVKLLSGLRKEDISSHLSVRPMFDLRNRRRHSRRSGIHISW